MKANVYSDFLSNLYDESPCAAYALESMKFNLMARIGLDEGDALEVVSKIVAKATAPACKQLATEIQAKQTQGKDNDKL